MGFSRVLAVAVASGAFACSAGWPDTPRIGDACPSDGCGLVLTCRRDATVPAGLCTKPCRTHDACRLDGDVAGYCTGDAENEGICLRSCLVGATFACGRDDGWSCVPTPTHAGACLPDCRVGAVTCPELTRCSPDTGRCDPVPGDAPAFAACGGTSGARCGDGALCLFWPGDANGRCFPACTSDDDCPAPQLCGLETVDGTRACTRPCDPGIGDCPEGLRCRRRSGTEIGLCTSGTSTGPRDEFETCSRAPGELCLGGLTCLVKRPEEGQGFCAFECASAFDCPPGRSCAVPVEAGQRACTLPCTQPGSLECNPGASCIYGECIPY